MSNYIQELAKFVKKWHGHEAAPMQTVSVKGIIEGNIVWDVAMKVFDRPATGHGLNVNFSRGWSWD